MKRIIARLSLLTLALLTITLSPQLSFAQEAPAPRKAPRTPVNRQTTYERRSDAPSTRNVQGPAVALDGEKLRVDSVDLRLFGIVPPQLSASFGPQARMALDQMISGREVGCIIRDRGREGHLMATCRTVDTEDLALELLKKGLAVAARGSLAGTELIQPYLLAEQDAQAQHLGLWSIALAASTQALAIPSPSSVLATTVTPGKSDSGAKSSSQSAAATTPVMSAAPATTERLTNAVPPQAQVKTSATAAISSTNAADFFARYQILIGNTLMLTIALSVLSIFAIRQRQDKKDELRAIAAALRGELQAARAVCFARVNAIATEQDDYETTWPRLRSTLYQAYVSHIGKLGAELARQIASIYGQASDYALYYQVTDETLYAKLPKRQALATLIAHIEAVLPRLATIEQTGQITVAQRALRAQLSHSSNNANAAERHANSSAIASTTAAIPSSTSQHMAEQIHAPAPQNSELRHDGDGRYDTANDVQANTAAASEYIQPPPHAVYAASPQHAIARTSVVTSIWESLRRFAQGRNALQAPATSYGEQQQVAYEQAPEDGGYAYDESVVYEEESPSDHQHVANERGQTRAT